MSSIFGYFDMYPEQTPSSLSLPSIFIMSVLQNGYTALILAALAGYADIVQTLVDHGAALDLRNEVTKLSDIVLHIWSCQ